MKLKRVSVQCVTESTCSLVKAVIYPHPFGQRMRQAIASAGSGLISKMIVKERKLCSDANHRGFVIFCTSFVTD
ncbi:hypothetical protein HYPGJ_30612 [Hyphomicrobium sp. GJ21]|nr:hypothetical protein HYPGJ_30612 [Hyphomicrobium sp. GJ21]